MNNIHIYSKDVFPFCFRAKALLQPRQIDYIEIDITSNSVCEQEIIDLSGRQNVPHIFVDGEPVGGYDDLACFNASGELDKSLGLTSNIDVTAI